MSFSAAQCRAARALLDWSQDDLAKNAQVARATIADFERNIRTPIRNNLVSIISCLEAAGVELISENGDDQGAGVRFRKVELEYSRNLKIIGSMVGLAVQYKGTPYTIIIHREILDDIDSTNYQTDRERVTAVQNHLPLFLRVAEQVVAQGKISDPNFVELAYENFPMGTFPRIPVSRT